MNAGITYAQYKKKIKKLKNALINGSCDSNTLQSKISEITQILKQHGISVVDDLLDNNILENLNGLYDKIKGIKDLYMKLFFCFYFKGKITKKLREKFCPYFFSEEKEREPTKKEILYDKIKNLQYFEYNEYKENIKYRETFIKTFEQKYNEIKNFYNKMLKEKVNKFDKDFFEDFIDKLNDIKEEIFGDKKQKTNNKNSQIIDNNDLNVNLNLVKGIPLKQRTFFYNKEKLIYGEDMQIEYKDYSFPFDERHKEEFKKQICGFLNSKGGRIFIGISDDKRVNGILLNYHERDKNTNDIVNLTYDFYPKCRTYVDVVYIPIKNKDNNYLNNLYVIKVIVSQGETNQLYSYTTKGFNSYLRLNGQCINLTAEEIRNELLKREKNPENKINNKEFKDPEPENPELIQATNSLEKQFKSMTLNISKKTNTNFKHHNSQVYNRNINNINIKNNLYNDSDDEEDEDILDMEEEEEEEEEEKEEIDGISSRRRGSRGGRGNRGGARVGKSRSGKREENKNKEDDKKNIRYKVKIQVNLKAGIIPTISEIKSTLNGAQNIRKKFVKKGKKIYGFMKFHSPQQALLYIQNFNSNINPLYEIKLIPKF